MGRAVLAKEVVAGRGRSWWRWRGRRRARRRRRGLRLARLDGRQGAAVARGAVR